MAAVRYAGFWRRALAHLLDSLLLNGVAWLGETLIFGGMYLIYAFLAWRQGIEAKSYDDAFNPLLIQVADAVLYLALAAPYFIWGQLKNRTTLGKRIFKIYVVNAQDGAPMTLKQAGFRFFGYLLSYLPFGTGFLMAAFHPQKRALHDLLVGTVSVIKE
ncbi:RDD family protein [Bdellovibrionota bacterium FG-1]